ncbi:MULTISPECIES: hypothetical protein [unclassified Ruminococcus]|uniref:hypothetical protein n=1 Tax=unclassified Ruminococcus TaxID=2608920 RepID=UPI00210DF163|nr:MULTISPECIES: hypothetical protein [unclassified Ruminococcus]MCQ4022584.1 hypothetical protein [Ruminococcus sp. zg-924]MCQ4114824.1 hypothetical protein [Ruminococcus sp. zg-921]
MFLRVTSKNIEKADTFMIECDGKKRPIDSFSSSASFDCGEQINCHANIEFVPQNLTMRPINRIIFVIKEILTAILFFLVFDKGAWYENIDPIRIKKKIAFKPSSDQTGEMSFEFSRSVFDKRQGKYSLPQLFVKTNGVVLSEEIGYLPNLGGVQLGFLHYIFQIVVPCVILLALCAYGIVASVFALNIPLLILLSVCAMLIIGFAIVMLFRGSRMKKCVENIILLQLKKLKQNGKTIG